MPHVLHLVPTHLAMDMTRFSQTWATGDSLSLTNALNCYSVYEYLISAMATEPPLVETGSQQEGEKSGEEPPAVASNKDAPATAGGTGEPPSPVMSPKDNPAADLRNMRRIIAEDPEWSLATVPMLAELCVKHIVDNFESKCSFLKKNPFMDRTWYYIIIRNLYLIMNK